MEHIQKIPLLVGEGRDARTLFDDSDACYVIPLYQRAFAWGTEKYSNRENEIVQLMDDIMDVDEDDHYYLGSLIVAKKGKVFEVIDGQQRLTALFLLFNVLGLKIKNIGALSYACRDRSNYAMRHIDDLMDDADKLDQPYEQSIYEGIKTIQEKIRAGEISDKGYVENMKSALRRVLLFRICVPEDTNLNRYFEIMNTRGEQLEQHDIVKAMLMRPLSPNECVMFSEVWNACRDMSGYVQMHFSVAHRELLFGGDWGDVPDIERRAYMVREWRKRSVASGAKVEKLTVPEVIEDSFKVSKADVEADNDDRIRFESIIGFPHFLLHVLKIYLRILGLDPDNANEALVGELLDDKKLISSFENVRRKVIDEGGRVNLSAADFSWGFLDCLLLCRYFFDKYIIKREYKEENADGEWSLQELKVSGARSSKRPYYVQTEFRGYRERGTTAKDRPDLNKMIQACLRVSYTSPKVMHWITQLLWWLCEKGDDGEFLNPISEYSDFAESLAASAVSEFVRSEKHDLGCNTPHIVFNFLDYLLWRDHLDGRKRKSFDFEFRNSVEHWHPQHPSDGMYGDMEDVDRFGNLCLIQGKANAKFSNLSPDSKKNTYKEMIEKGSLKLRLMAKLTEAQDGRSATEQWRDLNCEKHEEEMLNILKEAVDELCPANIASTELAGDRQ